MKQYRKLLSFTIISVGMFVMILDSRTALTGASKGIDLCIRTVIPSLFPFFILSIILTGMASSMNVALLKPIAKLCGIPSGAEVILLTGILGGYPVGAQCISNAYACGQLDRSDAERMLGFCNNAGPAFLFGMAGQLFDSVSVTAILWLIHIVSALLTGILLPRNENRESVKITAKSSTLGQAIQQSIRAMGNVCAWVVIFHMILNFAEGWFLWLLPREAQNIFAGLLEVSNGCISLFPLENDAVKFILAGVFISFGGVCVLMQTFSAVNQSGLNLGLYLPGKILQTSIAVFLTVTTAKLLFDQYIPVIFALIPVTVAGAVLMLLKKRKNNSSIPAFTGV